jgi:protein SCO1/2
MKQNILRFLLLIVIIGSGGTIVYVSLHYEPNLPIYNPSDINPQLVDKTVRGEMRNHSVGDFKLTNQLNKTITPDNFKDKIYVACFIFTTCEGICPAMTGNLKSVYKEFLDDDEIMFLSHSVTPEKDSVPVLKAYADKFDVQNHQKWHFTTAPRKHIYELARMHYFAATDSGDGGPSDFVHTENLVLVDKEKRLRGFYDGTDYDELDRLKEDITKLKEEY